MAVQKSAVVLLLLPGEASSWSYYSTILIQFYFIPFMAEYYSILWVCVCVWLCVCVAVCVRLCERAGPECKRVGHSRRRHPGVRARAPWTKGTRCSGTGNSRLTPPGRPQRAQSPEPAQRAGLTGRWGRWEQAPSGHPSPSPGGAAQTVSVGAPCAGGPPSDRAAGPLRERRAPRPGERAHRSRGAGRGPRGPSRGSAGVLRSPACRVRRPLPWGLLCTARHPRRRFTFPAALPEPA